MSPSRRTVLRAALALLAAACADPVRPDGRETPPPAAAVPDSLAFPLVPGGRLWLHGDARDSLGTPSDTLIRFTVEDSTVATVDAMGQVSGRRPGRTVVTGSAAGRTTRMAVVVRTVRYREVHPSHEQGGCALTTDGEALCWGRNDNGILGGETLRSCGWRSPSAPYVCGSWPSDGPTFVRTRERFATLSVGWGQRCGVTPDGRALCWGARADRPDGIAPCDTVPRGRCDYAPHEPVGEARWRQLAVHAQRFNGTACALDDAGAPWCWGYNWAGNAGVVEATLTVPEPTRVPGTPALRVLALGPVVSCGLDVLDALWCWGYRSYFGNDTTGVTGDIRLPVPTQSAGGMRFAAVSMHNGGCGLTRAGEAWCWWYGTVPRRAAPGLAFTQISAGEVSACGLTAEGEAWCWPYDRPPQRLTDALRFRTLAVREYDACGIALDGRAYCVDYHANGYDPSATIIGPPRAVAGQE